MRIPMLFLFVVVAAVFAVGCNTSPVLEVRDPYALSESNEPLMYETIRWALDAKGWRVEEEQPGAVLASVRAGGHEATVEVVYDDRGYAIRHIRSSPGLKFDGHSIHKRFNHWVDRLDNAIQNRLREVGY